MHENLILTDLGIIAVTSALVAILFHKLKFPVILGYVLVGLLLGPFLFKHSLIHDRENVQALSELGIIFLLFTLGMEFDLKKLQTLFGTSLVALILQTLLMVNIGLMVAPMLGYDRVIGIFLGSLLAISSSMVTIRVLEDQKAMQLPHAQLAVGILILEDILAILLLVVLSGISASGALPWASAIWSIFFLAVFVVGVFYVGRIVMPPLVKFIHKIGSLELVTVFAVGTVLGIGVLAAQFHLSLGLGAFVAGSLFTNSTLSHQIEHSIAPLKELFSAVFFVSTGMLINPTVILDQWSIILLLGVLVVVGKTASCGLGLFLSGQRTRSAFQAALAKSQIGEFSFVIAKLAQSMGLADEKLVSVAVGVSFITIFTTPIVSKQAIPLYKSLSRIIPKPIAQFGTIYHRIFCSVRARLGKTAFFALVKRPFWQIVVAFFLINGMIIAANMGSRWALSHQPWTEINDYIVPGIWLLTAVVVTPFLLSILRNLNAISIMSIDMVFSGSKRMKKSSSTFRLFISNILSILLIFLVAGTFISAISEFLPSGLSLLIFILLIGILTIVFQRQMIKLNSELEHRFTSSFHEETRELDAQLRMQSLEKFNEEFDWQSITSEKVISKNSLAAGKQIAELGLREKSGATIVAVSRGADIIYDPNPLAHLFAGDKVVLLGNEEQLTAATALLDSPQSETEGKDNTLQSEAVYLEPGSFLEGNTLAGSDLRKKHRITVVGIKHEKGEVVDPSPSQVLNAGDLLLIMGKRSHVEQFKNTLYSMAISEPTTVAKV